MTALQAEQSQRRNVITRALGLSQDVVVDIGEHTIEEGDRYLLCTDGLWGTVPHQQLTTIADTLPAHEACQQLVHLANEHSGADNVTVVIIDIGVVEHDANADAYQEASPTATIVQVAAGYDASPLLSRQHRLRIALLIASILILAGTLILSALLRGH